MADGRIYQIIADAQTDEIKFFNFFELGSNKPEEIGEAHASPLIHIWTLTIILNVIAEEESIQIDPAACPRPLQFVRPCFLASTSEGCEGCNCPEYTREISRDRKDWECANARFCSFERLDPGDAGFEAAAANAALAADTLEDVADCISLESLLFANETDATDASSVCRRRLWCGNSAQGWALGGSSLALMAGLLLYLSRQHLCVKRTVEPTGSDVAGVGTLALQELPHTCADLSCRAPILPGANFCETCGAEAANPATAALAPQGVCCNACGSALEFEGARFCSSCGAEQGPLHHRHLVHSLPSSPPVGLAVAGVVAFAELADHGTISASLPCSNVVIDIAGRTSSGNFPPPPPPAAAAGGGVDVEQSVVSVAGASLGNSAACAACNNPLVDGEAFCQTCGTAMLPQPGAGSSFAIEASASAAAAASAAPAQDTAAEFQHRAEASSAPADGAAGSEGSSRLDGIHMARLLASFHIVVGHLYAKGAVDSVYFFSWGFTWVPWFFMLSGYVNTHARLYSKKPDAVDPPLLFCWKRLAPIYPAYAVT